MSPKPLIFESSIQLNDFIFKFSFSGNDSFCMSLYTIHVCLSASRSFDSACKYQRFLCTHNSHINRFGIGSLFSDKFWKGWINFLVFDKMLKKTVSLKQKMNTFFLIFMKKKLNFSIENPRLAW